MLPRIQVVWLRMLENAPSVSNDKSFLNFAGTVRFLFQPAEEVGAGASHMMKEGALGDAEAIFAMHMDSTTSTGCMQAVKDLF